MTITTDRNYLRQTETKDLLLMAAAGDNELALVLGERLKDKEEEREPHYHCDGCICFDE